MWKSYRKDFLAIIAAFGLISYSVYVCAATPTVVVTAPAAKAVLDKKAEPAKKEVAKPAAKPAAKKEAAKPAEPAKKEHAKKPTLKAKYADKK